jgi:DNA polymerase-1
MKERTLLIDADVFAYQAASACEVATEWEDGYWTWHCDANSVKRLVLKMIEDTKKRFKGTAVVLCLTDSSRNWRLDVLPTYKGNRAATKKPLVLSYIKDWLIEEHDAYLRPSLEGDDCLGILATSNHIKGEKVIVSLDKDLKTIPALYVRDNASQVTSISPKEAEKYHMKQTLSGDTTDGYKGCPAVGLGTAEKIIEEGILKVPFEHTVLRGARKGEVETRFKDEYSDDLWACVVSHFEAAGLTEDDALVQARVARILHASDYDFVKKEPILWTPYK